MASRTRDIFDDSPFSLSGMPFFVSRYFLMTKTFRLSSRCKLNMSWSSCFVAITDHWHGDMGIIDKELFVFSKRHLSWIDTLSSRQLSSIDAEIYFWVCGEHESAPRSWSMKSSLSSSLHGIQEELNQELSPLDWIKTYFAHWILWTPMKETSILHPSSSCNDTALWKHIVKVITSM